MTSIANVKEHVSLRGIVMTVLTVVVAGLAIATLRYQPPVPDVGPVSPAPTSTTVPAGPRLAPEAAVATPFSTTEPPPTAQSEGSTELPIPTEASSPTESFSPMEAPSPIETFSPTETPSSSAAPASTAPSTPRRDTNPTELPNGGRRFGTVQP